jgi:tetratricopeptide (TPR) repeat protein
MEFVQGRSLDDIIAADGPLPPQRVAGIGLDVLNALRTAHAAGVVHRDVKPSNVLISDDRVVLTDFGIAAVEGEVSLTQPGIVMGAPAYTAPERARGEPAVAASDLWSLGATLFHAVEGHRPYEGANPNAVFHAILLGERAPTVHAGVLAPVLDGLLRKDLTHRLTADEAARCLARVLEATGPQAVSGGGSRHDRRVGLPPPVRGTAALPGSMSVAVSNVVSATRIAPRQLPAGIGNFVGRESQLAALTRLLEPSGQRGPALVISAITGTAGVGKTALAVHWGHQVSDHFPSGQLYVNLRGYGADPPMTSEQALDEFLRVLGVPGEKIPAGVEAQAKLYRSLLSGRRLLVLLDNAASAEQVRPLLPGAPDCLVVVTSRSRLSGLVARDGAYPVPVDLLGPGEAVSLLGRIVGTARVAAEPEASGTLARLCGYLPLALRVAAERVVLRESIRLADLVDELADEAARLDILAAEEDETTTVRTVFSWSYHALPPESARVFRLLSLHMGSEISTSAAAALTGLTAARARPLLDALAGAHLVQEYAPDRYRFHDLLRLYAAERAAEDSQAERATTVHRTLNWYLHSATAATRTFSPMGLRVPLDPSEPDAAWAPLSFADHGSALSWCEAERANLVAATRHAAEVGRHDIAWKLPAVLWDFFSLRGHWSDWIGTHEIALASARHIHERRGEAWIDNNLGTAYRGLERFEKALHHYREALAINREIGHLHGEGWTLYNLGDTYRGLGRFQEALDHLLPALAISRAVGERWSEGYTLNVVGDAYRSLGRFDEALDHYHQALAINRQISHRRGEGFTLYGLGDTYGALGRFDQALEQYQQALTIRREIGDRRGEARTLRSLGTALHNTGRPDLARESWRQALAILDDLEDPQAVEVRTILAANE